MRSEHLIVLFFWIFGKWLTLGVHSAILIRTFNRKHSISEPHLLQDEAAMTLEDRLMEQGRLSETGMRMAERRKYLAERCVEEGLDRPGNDSLHRPNAWEFLVNREHHLVWCNVFKAASTSWMYNFNLLAG